MKEQLKVSTTFRIITLTLIIIGAGTLFLGLISDPKRTWANYLIVNYYFLSLALGGAFFLVIQSISQSGWSAAFRRVPEAMMTYIPFAAVFFLLLCFGIHDLYHWSHSEAVAIDPLLQHKSAFLNVPFFFAEDDNLFCSMDHIDTDIKKIFSFGGSVPIRKSDNVIIFTKANYIQKYLFSFLQLHFPFQPLTG